MLTFRLGVGGGDDADVGCDVTTGCVFSLLSIVVGVTVAAVAVTVFVVCDIFFYE